MGFAIFLSYRRESPKSGGTQDSYTAAMKFCAVVFLQKNNGQVVRS